MAEKPKDKMELWNLVCVTDVSITKEVDEGGRKYHTIDAQHQIKKATEMWGPMGTAWGLKNLVWGEVGKLKTTFGKKAIPIVGPAEITLSAIFYSPEGEFEIGSDIYWRPDGDSRKKLRTDVLTKALSNLGFNSDVFEGKFDGNKYANRKVAPTVPVPTPAQAQAQQAQAQAPYVPPPMVTPVPQAAYVPPPAQGGAVTNGRKSKLHIDNCEYKMSKSGNPQLVVAMRVVGGEFVTQKFKEYFQFPMWNGTGAEPFPHHKTRRFLDCVGFTYDQVVQNPAQYAPQMENRQFEADMKEEEYQGKPVLKIDGIEMSQAGPAQSTTAPAQAGPPNLDGVDLDADINLDEDEDYLTN